MVFNECPFCHKLFSAEEVSRKQVASGDYTPSITPRLLNPDGRRAGATPRPEDYPTQDFVQFEATYRCKHCGKEWTKLSRKEVDIPREYGQAEDESTENEASERTS